MGNPPTLETSATPGTDADLRANVPVLDRTQPAQIELAPLDRVPEDLTGRGRVGRQLRLGRRREALPARAPGDRKRAAAPSAGLMPSSKITLIIENPTSLDDRTTRTPRSPREAQRQRVGHLVFDLSRPVPLPPGEDDHLVFRKVGNRVDRRLPGRKRTKRRQGQARADDQGPVPDREGDDGVDHVTIVVRPPGQHQATRTIVHLRRGNQGFGSFARYFSGSRSSCRSQPLQHRKTTLPFASRRVGRPHRAQRLVRDRADLLPFGDRAILCRQARKRIGRVPRRSGSSRWRVMPANDARRARRRNRRRPGSGSIAFRRRAERPLRPQRFWPASRPRTTG